MVTIPEFSNDIAAAIGRTPVEMQRRFRTLREAGYFKRKGHGHAAQVATDADAVTLLLAMGGAELPIDGPAAVERFSPITLQCLGTLDGYHQNHVWSRDAGITGRAPAGIGEDRHEAWQADISELADRAAGTLADALRWGMQNTRDQTSVWQITKITFNRSASAPYVHVQFAPSFLFKWSRDLIVVGEFFLDRTVSSPPFEDIKSIDGQVLVDAARIIDGNRSWRQK